MYLQISQKPSALQSQLYSNAAELPDDAAGPGRAGRSRSSVSPPLSSAQAQRTREGLPAPTEGGGL